MTSMTPTTEFERGARAAIEAFGLYFVDENQHPIYEELGATTLESFAENAAADTLADETARLKRTPAPDNDNWDETNLRAELCALRSELDEARANTLWGIRHAEAGEGNTDWTAEDENEARYEQENFGGQLISRTAGDWVLRRAQVPTRAPAGVPQSGVTEALAAMPLGQRFMPAPADGEMPDPWVKVPAGYRRESDTLIFPLHRFEDWTREIVLLDGPPAHEGGI